MIDFFQRLIDDRHQCCRTGSSVLEEKQTVMKVTISHPTTKALVFRIPDHGKAHSGAIKPGPDYNKACDFLLFVKKSNSLDVYFVELKKTLNPNPEGIPVRACKQILFTVPILDYLRSMVKIHFGKQPDIQQHFVVIGEKLSSRINKSSVKPRREFYDLHYCKRQFRIIHSVGDRIRIGDLK